MSKWSEAAERYRVRSSRPEQPRVRPAENKVMLADFLGSADGKDALELLKASKHIIRFAEDHSTTACIRCWVLTGDGLRITAEVGGAAAAYASGQRPPSPSESPTTPEEIEKAWTGPFGQGKEQFTDELVPWLRQELDLIADAAP